MTRSVGTFAPTVALAIVGALGLSGLSVPTAERQGAACLHGPDETVAEDGRTIPF
jgi:hypothetical protein